MTTRSPHGTWANLGLFVLVFLAMAVPRWAVLPRAATIDEAKWSMRAANFLAALGSGNVAWTYQSEHPGVTTMWAGALGLGFIANDYAKKQTQLSYPDEVGALLEAQYGRSALDALVAGRAVMVFFNALALSAAYVYARRLLGLPAALLGALLMAFSPFLAAHTQLLHLDGLSAALLFLALMAYLSFGVTRHPSDLLIAGFAAGLSWLTKIPALFLLPFLGALTLAQLVQARGNGRQTLVAILWPFVAWTTIAALTLVLFWPAMWVAPLDSARQIISGALGYAGGGHEDAVFFNGRIYADGRIPATALHFYPLNYLWRATPLTLLGLPLGALAWYRRCPPLAARVARRTALILLLFALAFGLFMTLGDKKFDRYLLPAYPPLALLAASGWVGGVGRLARRVAPQRQQGITAVLLSLVALLQLAALLSVAPTYLSYYNPLLGGSRRAPQVMQIGWGEGLEEAARYLNQKPDSAALTVASWYRSSFDTYFEGETLSIKADPTPGEQAAIAAADYVVIYIHQWQRDLPPELLARLAAQAPEHTVWINGLAYAQVYDLRDLPP